MAFSDHFVGVPQSRWTGYAILAAVIAVALSILFGKDRIPIGKRVLIIVIMFLFALPTIALVLFQLTCLVNGTSKAPFCGWYAWIVAVLTIIYCILLIIIAITVKASDKQADAAEKFSVSYERANVMAKKLMGGSTEMFEDMDMPQDASTLKSSPDLTLATAPPSPSAALPPVSNPSQPLPSMPIKPTQPKPTQPKPNQPKPPAKKDKFVDYAKSDDMEEEKETFADYVPVNGGKDANMYML